MFWAGPKVINPPASTLASHFWPFSPGIIIRLGSKGILTLIPNCCVLCTPAILKTFVIRSFFFKKWLLTHVLGGAQGHKSSCKHACVAFLTFFPWYHHIYIKNRNKKGVPFPWNSHQNLPDSFARPPATKKTGTNGLWNFVKLFARSTNASAPVPVINTATKQNCLTAILLRLFLAQYLFSIFTQQKSPTPQPPISAKPDLSMRLQGLEPWTNRLRVYCSTNWAKGAFSWTQRWL